MKDKYPYISKESLELHLTYEDCELYLAKKTKDLSNYDMGMKEYNRWTLSKPTSKYLIGCDGKTQHKDIVSKLNLPFELIGDSVLEGLMNIGVVLCSDTPTTSKEIFITGNFETLYPAHMSVELTDYCNLRCKHCYVSSSPDNIGERPFEDVVEAIYKLKKNGVKSIELTGGECTTYSKFREILKICSEEFHLVAVVSNGYLIGKYKSLANYISSFKNVCVQVSIDGMKEYHNEFRNKENSYEYAVDGIKFLKENNTIVRIGSVITKDNLKEIDDLYNLAKDLNVDAWSVSTVSLFGRGKNVSDKENNHEIELAIKKALEKYKGDKLFESNLQTVRNMIKNREINCGAGWRSFTLNSKSGDFRTCLFLSDSKGVGNIYSDDYEYIFTKDKTGKFKNLPNPSHYLAECCECKHIESCKNCFANALEVIKSEDVDCPWKNKYLQNINI